MSEAAQQKMYQVKQGMPKHPQLQRMMEDSNARRLLEKMDDAMLIKDRQDEARSLARRAVLRH
jgi:hypothetical protein